jgi:hypothetical protein
MLLATGASVGERWQAMGVGPHGSSRGWGPANDSEKQTDCSNQQDAGIIKKRAFRRE